MFAALESNRSIHFSSMFLNKDYKALDTLLMQQSN